MQVATLLATYQPGMDGNYKASWDHTIDSFVHRTLAELTGRSPAVAYFVHILSATLDVNRAVVQQLRDPENEIRLLISYRINQFPETYKARIVFYAGDLTTLEPPDEQTSPLPC